MFSTKLHHKQMIYNDFGSFYLNVSGKNSNFLQNIGSSSSHTMFSNITHLLLQELLAFMREKSSLDLLSSFPKQRILKGCFWAKIKTLGNQIMNFTHSLLFCCINFLCYLNHLNNSFLTCILKWFFRYLCSELNLTISKLGSIRSIINQVIMVNRSRSLNSCE